MTQPFDFDKALTELQAGKDLTGKDGVLMPLIKQLTEAAITAELDHHLAHEDKPNRKNGMGSKIVKTGSGSFELNAPRDRAGTFEHQLIKKHQSQLNPEIDRKIISLFSHGMSYRDIQYHLQDLYGVDVSTGALSAITDQLLPAATKTAGAHLSGDVDGCCSLQNQARRPLYRQGHLHPVRADT